MKRPWRILGHVNVSALAALVPSLPWPQGGRLPIPPEAGPIIRTVLKWLPEGAVVDFDPGCLALLRPGQSFPMHQDGHPEGWITLVHVPIVTNPRCWHLFKGGSLFHMEAGVVGAFDSSRLHSYGNDGDTDRVHLIFDVVRG